jgi:hypothetical protein
MIAPRASEAQVASMSAVARFLNGDVSSLSRAVNRYRKSLIST